MIQTRELEEDLDYSDRDSLLRAGLRFFTPLEVARLHAFPVDVKSDGADKMEFEFPEGFTLRQKWKLLGNSLNVKVVGDIISANLK